MEEQSKKDCSFKIFKFQGVRNLSTFLARLTPKATMRRTTESDFPGTPEITNKSRAKSFLWQSNDFSPLLKAAPKKIAHYKILAFMALGFGISMFQTVNKKKQHFEI